MLPLDLVLEFLPQLCQFKLLEEGLSVGVECVDAVAVVRDDGLEFLLLKPVHAGLNFQTIKLKMQNDSLDKLTQSFIIKMPFIKALIISDLTEGVEVFKYSSPDLSLQQGNEDFVVNVSSLRAAMNSLYSDFKSQLAKVCDCKDFKISLMYD